MMSFGVLCILCTYTYVYYHLRVKPPTFLIGCGCELRMEIPCNSARGARILFGDCKKQKRSRLENPTYRILENMFNRRRYTRNTSS